MNSLIKEESQNRELFRELFISMKKKLLRRFEGLKNNSVCKNCHACCELRYLEFSTFELKVLAKNDKYWRVFLEFFEEQDFSNKKTPEKFKKYVEKVQKTVDFTPFFYSCRFFKGGSCHYDKEEKCFCKKSGLEFDKIMLDNCCGLFWQEKILDDIKKRIFKDIFIKNIHIKNSKEDFSCNCCGICCKLASSDFSYEELQKKAKLGDNFAKQFVEIFVPYKNINDARMVYPEYFDFLKKKLSSDENIYFYHCKKLGEDGLCTDYQNRPDICRDFPDNPLGILPNCCEYKAWKEDTEVLALSLQALEVLSRFYCKMLKDYFKVR